jgi:hypothetical protein
VAGGRANLRHPFIGPTIEVPAEKFSVIQAIAGLPNQDGED